MGVSTDTRRMVLHIGYPKTGTSTLQRFLYVSRDELAERDVLYPADSERRMAQHNVAWSISADVRFEPEALTFDQLEDLWEQSGKATMILSSEDFVQNRDPTMVVDRVREFAERTGVAIDVVVFVRAQHAYINSLYSQRAKFFTERRRFAEFVTTAVKLPMVDYGAHLEGWDEGENVRLIPVPFTSQKLKPNLETVFCDAAGLTDRVGDLLANADRDRINTSPGPLTVEVCRRVAAYIVRKRGGVRALEPGVHAPLSGYVRRMADRATGEAASTFNGVDNELRDQIYERFAEGNEAFAQRYWGAPWREVYAGEYERDLVPNEFDPKRASPEERKVVRTATRRAVRKADEMLERGPRRRPAARPARSRSPAS